MKYYDIQEAVHAFRRKRLADLKRMFPSLPKKRGGLPRISTAWLEPSSAVHQESRDAAMRGINPRNQKCKKAELPKSTMSKKMQGLSNAEIIEEVKRTPSPSEIIAQLVCMNMPLSSFNKSRIHFMQNAKSLSRHSFKVCCIGDKSNNSTITNVQMLRASSELRRFQL